MDIANSDIEDFMSCGTMLGVEDAFSVGSKFTWTSNHHWAKLDRVLLNSNWTSLHWDSKVEFLDFNSLSDHTPMIVSLSTQIHSKCKPFKFLNMWTTHPKFMDMVRSYWHLPVEGTKQFILCMKLKALKQPLKNLNKLEFSHISEKVKKAQDEFVIA